MMRTATALAAFAREEQGQDMVEYTLLLAFFVLAGAALYVGISNNINGIWTGISNRLANSN
jgi:Flp pilus assembly pilin Flp